MEANCTNKKTFTLTENGQELGDMVYENLFLLKAEIKLANAEHYDVKPVGFFGTSVTVTKNGTEMVTLKMNWRGQIVFDFHDGEELVFKPKSTFSNQYIIENKGHEKLLQFDANFNWRKFNYNYKITYEEAPRDILLVFLGVYAANYYIAVMSGST